MRIKFRFFLPLLMVCLPACESFIELGDDGLGVVLMMNAQICTADTSHIIWLSYSSPSSIVPVEDGVVSCFVNGQLVSTVDAMSVENEIPLSVSGNVSYGVGGYCIKARMKPGDQVCIRANAGDCHCEASLEVPPAPVIIEANAVPCERDPELELGRYRFDVRILDLKDELNYYYFRLLDNSYIEVEQAHPQALFAPGDVLQRQDRGVEVNTTREPLLNSGARMPGSQDAARDSYFDNRLNLFTDALFRDGEYALNVYTEERFYLKPDSYEAGDVFIAHNNAVVRICSLTREEYLYLSGYQFVQSAESGTVFTEDFVFPNNVNGGLGFVSINTATDYEIVFQPQRFEENDFM